MEFRLLGAFEVWDGEQPVEIAGAKRRALLALLVLRANEVVRSELLVDELWGERPPRYAASALQTHVSRLRKTLGADTIASREWGYVLRAAPADVDLRRFESLVAEAESLAAKPRAAKLAEALALWRGPPLADLLNEPSLQREIARLEELRLRTLELRIDADLEAGENGSLVGELEGLIAEHPLRESLRGQLILALYRAGRQAEALEVYRETRRVLVEEMGIEPSPELRELEAAILRQDPALTSDPTPRFSPREQPPPPGRWRWPRSPLAIGATTLATLALAAGLVVAFTAAASTSTKPRHEHVVVADAFDTGVLNPQLWGRRIFGKGVGLAEQDQRLDMWFNATSHLPSLRPGIFAAMRADVWTRCTFSGNFDASVDFRLLNWPVYNGVYVSLGTSGIAMERQALGSGDQFTAWHPAPPGHPRSYIWARNRPTRNSERQGSLRIERVGSTLSAYYKTAYRGPNSPVFSENQWVWLASYHTRGKIRPAHLYLQTLSPPNGPGATAFRGAPVRVAYDNFFVSADASTCS